MSKKEPNFKGSFLLGIILIGLGSAFISIQPKALAPVFIGIGAIFMLYGMKNKDKWK